MKKRKRNPIRKYKSKSRYVHKKLRSSKICAKGSFRTISIGKRGKKLVICCPKGYWRLKRCGVGTKAVTMLVPRVRTFKAKRRKAANMRKDAFGFMKAISGKPLRTYRIYARLKDGGVGITAWYSEKEIIEDLKGQIVRAGHSIIKVEEGKE